MSNANALNSTPETSVGTAPEETIAQNKPNVNTPYSLSADSNGNALSKEQQTYFKDSKVVDENGNLLVM